MDNGSVDQKSYVKFLGHLDSPAMELSQHSLSHVAECVKLLSGNVKGLSKSQLIEILRSLSILRDVLKTNLVDIMKLAQEVAENIDRKR